MHIDVNNLDNLGVALYWVNTNTDPGVGGTNYFSYASSPHCGTRSLGPFYSGRGGFTIDEVVPVNRLLGMPVTQADSFRAPVASTPTDLVYSGIGIYSTSTAAFTAGVSFAGHFDITVHFYARQDLLTAYLPDPAEKEAERLVFKAKRYASDSARLERQEELSRALEDDFQQRVGSYLGRLSLTGNGQGVHTPDDDQVGQSVVATTLGEQQLVSVTNCDSGGIQNEVIAELVSRLVDQIREKKTSDT